MRSTLEKVKRTANTGGPGAPYVLNRFARSYAKLT